jgi:hypothetical protein
MNQRVEFDSITVGMPFISVSLKIFNQGEKNILSEIIIRSADKRFLTSWQCCSNCTKYAIDSLIDYRKFLIDKKVELSKIKSEKLVKVVDYILEEIKSFLSISEKCNPDHDYRFLSEQLDVLRTNILNTFKKLCNDTKLPCPKDFFRMLKIVPAKHYKKNSTVKTTK